MSKLLTKDINAQTIIEQALKEPGTIAGCYSMFRDFSANNCVSFAIQLKEQGLPITPVMSSSEWVKKGYITEDVRKKNYYNRLWGLLPVTEKVFDENGEPVINPLTGKQAEKFKYFKTCKAWLASSQLGITVKQEVQADFDENEVLTRLGLTMKEWGIVEGNAQGYAIPNEKVIAINPLCTKRVDTFLHEVAHCLLHSKDNKIVDGVELDRTIKEVEAECVSYVCMVMLGIDDEKTLSNARGYIQNWLGHSETKEFKNYSRVIKAVNVIMKAIGNHKGNYKAGKADFQE